MENVDLFQKKHARLSTALRISASSASPALQKDEKKTMPRAFSSFCWMVVIIYILTRRYHQIAIAKENKTHK